MVLSRNTPDTGWAWIVLTSSFFIQMLSAMFIYGTGIMKLAILEEFKEDLIKVDWLGSLHVACSQVIGPVVSLVISRFHCQPTIFFGGLLVFIGTLSSAFIKNIYILYITFGVVAGIGHGFCYTLNVVGLGYYFKKRLYFAAGIATSGAGIAMVVFPPAIQRIFNYYQLQGGLMLISAICLHFSAFGLLIAPNQLEIKSKRHFKKQQYVTAEHIPQRPSIFRNLSFDFYIMSILWWNLAYTFIAQGLPYYSNSTGNSKYEAAFLMSIAGIGSICGRLLGGITANDSNVDSIVIYFGTSGVLGFGTLFFKTFAQTYLGQAVFSVCWGLYTGANISVQGPIVVRLLGVEQLPAGYGLLMFFTGIGSLIGPPIGGLLMTSAGNAEISFVAAGIATLVSCFTGIVIVVLERNVMVRSNSKLSTSRSISMSMGRMSQGKTRSLYTLNDLTLEISPDADCRYRAESNISDVSSFL
ncbi:monocarboxylate transporter 9 [Octopus bimaculoides]|uniref:Major facilitator superfamily (MFS) profile domain-containing protein n=1 Tax=Octopus bimaculoides TaxID=37653 RepID=A0A0L8G712_OCTBM|nr:monocarboxylate transporter 9 [Octopus bimaculoides]|eukprot:XP_014783459.1 PREDICTED: monocarboxylate transporter 9-like [Octopus bimaculoides]